jgi:RNA polymerase sigma-70 factor (ECF subfamily)
VAKEDVSPRQEVPDDRELVRQCLRGSEAAFGRLVQRYAASVTNLALRVVRDRDDADDVAQETFIKAHGALRRYDPTYPFRVWLFRIAYNAAIDHVRRRRPGMVSTSAPRRIGGEDVEWELVDETTAGPHEAALVRDRRAALDRAIEELPPALRAAIVLRHVEDLSYEEIAATLGVPLGTVKIRIHRGREALARILRRDFGEEEIP